MVQVSALTPGGSDKLEEEYVRSTADTRVRRACVAAAAILGLLAMAACTASTDPPEAAETSAATPTAVCTPATADRPSAPALADTVWPSEHADPWRTHAVAAGPELDRDDPKLTATSITLPPAPVWGYTGTDGELYVIGGAPYLLDMFTEVILHPDTRVPPLVPKSKRYSETVTPYVARIDPAAMSVEVIELTEGTSANYTGGLLVHENGNLYAVSRSTLYKIDRGTFSMTASLALPLAPDESGAPNPATAYNGMVATADGDLILKGWASTGGGDDAPGLLLRIDPDDLSITALLETTVITSARMAMVESDGVEHIYMPGKTDSLRFRVDADGFALDDGFSQPYLEPDTGQSQASSDIFMGEGVVFTDNTSPTATTPMRIFSQSVAGSGSPLAEVQAFDGDDPSWNFFMVAGDPYRTGMVIVADQLGGQLAGYRACAGGEEVQRVWTESLAGSAGVAIDYQRGILYADDRSCSGDDCDLFVVALDLETGEELTRVPVAGTKPSIGQIFIGPDGAVYYPATETGEQAGFLTRVTVG